MTNCFFCGSVIETMGQDELFKDRPGYIDRYFKDKRKGYEKTICKVCAPPYMQRQFVDQFGLNEYGEIDGDKFADFVMANFEKVMLQ